MDDADSVFDEPLTGLKQQAWLERFAEVVNAHGSFTSLDSRHSAALLERGATLLVTFETIEGLRTLSAEDQPLGWSMSKSHGWSHLCLLSSGDTWFRAQSVYNYFDSLIDDGFFDEYSNVVFYGAGPCGYAAAAFSVAAPGSKVLVIQPQATLDPRVTEWDDRFVEMRREDFNTRFGYAPDMIDAADHVYVAYDPMQQLDAMHAALFTRSNVTKLRMRFFGSTLQSDILSLDMLTTMLERTESGELDYVSFARLFRRRRNSRRYLRGLLMHLTQQERINLGRVVATNVSQRIRGPFFLNWLRDHPVDTGDDE
ncbi:MAG: phosphoadenosine phosphosulfate reductase [Rhodobacteraceae bacterium]|nr:phosphoadenosine phosphosulfate reductase [Paracoccaceae bacterium]